MSVPLSHELLFANKLAEACYARYDDLPKTGKPNAACEWTLLSAVVQANGWTSGPGTADGVTLEVVSLGTGSKCIGQNEMSPRGDVLNDSHAEVIARRGFMRYLYEEVEVMFTTGTSKVFAEVVGGRCVVRDDVSFHFFTSHTPCGDASIFLKTDDDDFGTCLHPTADVHCSKDNGDINCMAENLFEFKNKCDNYVDGCDTIQTLTKAIGVDASEEKIEVAKQILMEVRQRKESVVDNCKSVGSGLEGAQSSSPGQVSCESLSASRSYSRTECSAVHDSSMLDRDKEDTRSVAIENSRVGSESVRLAESENVTVDCSTLAPTDLSKEGVVKSERVRAVSKRPAAPHVANPRKRFAGADVHRTGAKCVPEERPDPGGAGTAYHVLGAVRTKPGRGDPTLALSCSDKMARWGAVGLQGALLSLLVASPVRVRSIVVGGGCPFSRDALHRAVAGRSAVAEAPLIVQASAAFRHGRGGDDAKRPCASSVAWCAVQHRPLEVAVKGRKQGVTKKVLATPAGRLQISKVELFRRFLAVAALLPAQRGLAAATYRHMSYRDAKDSAADYQRDWATVRNTCFPMWPVRDRSFLDFSLRD